jgi:uncharacterized SAM-dependent methyltransferase
MAFSGLEQDYIDLFTGRRKAHLSQYVHAYRPDIYDKVVNSDSFYIYKLERQIIQKFAGQIISELDHISHVVELGPGSSSPVLAKTIPILSALQKTASIRKYTALDITEEYAIEACEIVKRNWASLETDVIISDFVSDLGSPATQDRAADPARAIFCFGGTIFCNSLDSDVDKVLGNISHWLKDGDYFIFGVDISSNKGSLYVTYCNKLVHELLLNVMYNLKQRLRLDDFDPAAFDLIFEWDAESRSVVLYLCATKAQQIRINDQEIIINKDDKYNVINSRKFLVENVRKMLEKYGMQIAESFVLDDELGNEFAILKARKF